MIFFCPKNTFKQKWEFFVASLFHTAAEDGIRQCQKRTILKKNTKDGETDNYRETEEREDDIKIENMKNGETDMTIKERNRIIWKKKESKLLQGEIHTQCKGRQCT